MPQAWDELLGEVLGEVRSGVEKGLRNVSRWEGSLIYRSPWVLQGACCWPGFLVPICQLSLLPYPQILI